MDDILLHSEVTDQILKAYYHVYNSLGHGFLEKVYQNAMIKTLNKAGIDVQRQVPIVVYFEGEPVGEYFADLVVAGRVIVELKAVESLAPAHAIQLTNYLRATQIEVGLLLNFGEEPTFRRKVFANNRKKLIERG